MIKKILLIEDQRRYFDYYKALIDQEGFEVINNEPIFDRSDVSYRTRDEQQYIIQELIDKNNYDIILCDLNLRKEEEDYSIGMMDRCLSVCIYFANKQKLKDAKKNFIFVTRRNGWREKDLYKIEGMEEDDKLIRCVHSTENYPHCPHIDAEGFPICKEEFNNCKASKCFNKRLGRMTDE